MIKVVWLTPYNIFKLLPEIKLNRAGALHSSSWIHSLSEQLALNKDIELHIITHSQYIDNNQVFKKNDIYFHIIKYNFPFLNRGFPWYLPIDKLTGYQPFSRRAQTIIRQIKPDVLHVHGTEGGYFLPAFKTDIPFIISIQGIISEIIKIDPHITGFLQSFYERYAVRKAKYFGCRTAYDFNYVKTNNSGAIIFDLPEAINKAYFEHQWKAEPGLTLLFVGSVMKRKGIEDLIHAVNYLKGRFPEIRLKIIGSGAKGYIHYLNQIIQQYNLEQNIFWLGTKTPHEIAQELARANIFVLPSLIDNSPNCLAEAMAVGVPSIATNVGGIPSMVHDKIDGLLFEKHDIIGLVDTIMTLADDPNLQNKLSCNAKQRVLESNYPSLVTKKYVDVYNLLSNERS